ncbi:MAG: hypothetical protein HQL69_23710 [Magnetococcales bacterium]|nr:hypothetical protein [Magnetococcales bacterium]
MSILIIIDGLIMEGDPATGAYCKNVTRLAAVASTGRVDLAQKAASPDEGVVYSDLLLGPDYWGESQKLPLGYLAALGMGLQPDPQKSWGVVGLLHLFQKTNKLLFFSPERVGLGVEEKEQLILGLQDEFAHHGFTIHWVKEWATAVVSADGNFEVSSLPLATLEGQSFFDCLPQGKDANSLVSLVTTGQMLLARDAINNKRKKKELLPLNTPWLWGVGRCKNNIAQKVTDTNRGCLWSSDAIVAGLGRLAGLQTACIDEKNGVDSATIAKIANFSQSGLAVIHFQTPTKFARLGMLEQRQSRLQQIDEHFITPLVEKLAGVGEKLTITTSATLDKEGQPVAGFVPWVAAHGEKLIQKKRFWHRNSIDSGAEMEIEQFNGELAL